jgi:hypothetical protein
MDTPASVVWAAVALLNEEAGHTTGAAGQEWPGSALEEGD